MGRNATTGITSTADGYGIGIGDLSSALHNASLDLGYLITYGSTNKWAKFKSVRNSNPGIIDLSVRKANNYGLSVVSCGRVDFASSYQSTWSLALPRGKGGGPNGYDEWYRILDFDGYQENCWWQRSTPGSGRIAYTIFNGVLTIPSNVVSDLDTISFDMQCRENSEIDPYLNLLYPNDFQGATKDFSGYYIGFAILDANGGVWIYSDPQVSAASASNPYAIVYARISSSIPNGAIKIAPVLTQNRQASWSNGYNGDIIILDGAYLSATKMAGSASVQTSVTFTITSSSVTMAFSITNQTGSAVTINNMYAYLLSDGAYMNEHDSGYSGPDYMGEGAADYINRTWPSSYKQGDIYSHDWDGGSTNPDQLAARAYNIYTDFVSANGGSNVIGNGVTRTWSKTFNYTGDEFGSYSNGAWLLWCLSPSGNAVVREYSSNNV